MSDPVYIKCRETGKKAWWFLTGTGGMNRLRLHAAPTDPTTIKEQLEQLTRDNPGFEFKQAK